MTARAMPAQGTRVSIRPGEWQIRPGQPGHTYHDIRVVSVHDSHDPAYAWVYGHGLECAWESADCTAPFCWELLVKVEVLVATAAGERS
ncbi:hypothetical protein DLJ59_29290 [Micromonospora inaquosa]|uniref:Uncharacterized protein n=1 Tax=Micromonospora inaquosa TaxID=2203716 RepID=A0A3N9WTL3_9ACTN|nr:hypothetical protein DLJ59_29290 [Micromonospora inaquosa]